MGRPSLPACLHRESKSILNHPKEYVLFGTDSPWRDQATTLTLLKGLNLGSKRENLILGENAAALLDFV